MSDETLELLWSMLTNEQLLELREKGAMDDRTMASFKTELFKRCLIQFDEAADAALKQIYEKRYKEELIQRGVSEDRIYCYGVAFKGKQVVIKMGK